MPPLHDRVSTPLVSRLSAVQCAWALTVLVLWVAAAFTLPIDADYTSGELLDHALAWRSGEPLYADVSIAPYRVLNYPPAVFAVVRALGAVGLDPLLAGRIVGTLGVLAALAALHGWLADDGIPARVRLAIVALCGASFPMMYSAGQFHIEGLAVAATLAGYRYCARNARRQAVLGGALLAAGCLIKQTQVVPALVALAWLARYRTRDAPAAVGAFAVVGMAGCALITAAFGLEAWRHILTYTVGTFSVSGLGWQLLEHALPWSPIAVLALVYTLRSADRRRDLRGWYLVGSSFWLLSAARLGAGYPYFLDWQLATLVGIAPLVQQWALAEPSGARAVRRGAVMLFGAYVAIADIVVPAILAYHVRTGRRTQVALEALCGLIPRAPALIITESPGAARACGGRSALHPFIMANLSRRGLWDDRPFVRDILAGRYPVMLLDFDIASNLRGVHADRWSPRVLETLRTAYVQESEREGWRVFRLRRALPLQPTRP